MKDPTLWSADDATEFERRLLDAARDDRIPSELQLRMAGALMAPPLTASGNAAASGVREKVGEWTAGNSAAPKVGALLSSKAGLWGSLVVAALAAGAGFSALRPAAPAAVTNVAVPSPTALDDSPPPVSESSTPAAGLPAPLPVSSSSRTKTRSTTTMRAVATREPVRMSERVSEPIRGELELLDRAREALRNGAGERARTLLDQYAQRFAHGALAPEAEVLRIEALMRSGEPERAEQLSQRFLRNHPAHPLAGQVATLVASHSH
jgi:TolA-binding protein